MDPNTPKSSKDQGTNDSSTTKAPKDKNCQFCGQAFTSSSLGRHLDLYIKEKNPKPPDGIHDVEAIRRLRGGITRRQPRISLARRETSTPAGTPGAASRKSPVSEDAETSTCDISTAVPKDNAQPGGAATRRYPFKTPWEATGVIVDIPDGSIDSTTSRTDDGTMAADGGAAAIPGHAATAQRSFNRNMMKSQLDMKQKLRDALDTARAAELALREVTSSLRAAKCVPALR